VGLTPEQAAQLRREVGALLVAAVDRQAIIGLEIGAAAALAAVVRHGGELDIEQARRAWRLLSRNAERLHAVGLTMPTPPAEQVTPVIQPAPPQRAGPQVALRPDRYIGVRGAPFGLNDALKTVAHAAWDSTRREWYVAPTPVSVAVLSTLLEPHQPAYSAGVSALLAEFRASTTTRALLDPFEPVPDVDMNGLLSYATGQSPWEHQIRGVAYASQVSACLLAVKMGGGKSAMAIAAVNRMAAQRIVIVCPNKVRGVWPREVAKWSTAKWHLSDGRVPARRKGAQPQDLPMAKRLQQAEEVLFDCACGAAVHAAVFNYEMMAHSPLGYQSARSPGWVPPVMLDAVIYDEIQRLKSPTGRVSKTAQHWVPYFAHRIGLSGTPMPQYAWDIFGIYRALDPGILGTLWTPFKAGYVKMKQPKDGGKEFPVSILKEKRREFADKVHSIMYRPTVDLDVPPVRHEIRAVALEPKARREYDRLDNEHIAFLSEFARQGVTVACEPIEPVELDEEPILTPRNPLAATLRLRQFTGGTIPDDGEVVESATGKLITRRTLYRVSWAKQAELRDIFDEVGCIAGRDGGPEPVCVYAAFRPDLDAIAEAAHEAGLRYAEISGRRCDGLTDTSEMTPDADVVGVQIASGGTGVDLTRAAYGVFYSAAYSVSDHDQALARQHRPGQKNPVLFIHLLAEDTHDIEVYRSMASRRSAVAAYLVARKIPLDVAGLSEDDVPPELTLEQIAEQFNSHDGEHGRTGGGGVRLPIDSFATDVFEEPAWMAKRAARRAPGVDELAEFDLDGMFEEI
jgi:hypothetical protein